MFSLLSRACSLLKQARLEIYTRRKLTTRRALQRVSTSVTGPINYHPRFGGAKR